MPGSKVVTDMIRWPASIPPGTILVAVFFSAAVGVGFERYPARIDPVEALRSI